MPRGRPKEEKRDVLCVAVLPKTSKHIKRLAKTHGSQGKAIDQLVKEGKA